MSRGNWPTWLLLLFYTTPFHPSKTELLYVRSLLVIVVGILASFLTQSSALIEPVDQNISPQIYPF